MEIISYNKIHSQTVSIFNALHLSSALKIPNTWQQSTSNSSNLHDRDIVACTNMVTSHDLTVKQLISPYSKKIHPSFVFCKPITKVGYILFFVGL